MNVPLCVTCTLGMIARRDVRKPIINCPQTNRFLTSSASSTWIL